MVDEFDLDIKLKKSDDSVEPDSLTPVLTSSVPCANAIIASVRLCTRITCRGCF
ncbi:FDLD family class I lanthipeptide [Gracilibacillus sp. HCP3S3_G5_2]|uniref:FDLD family class I lanthipeptide n=1 Tax=Gracilibacillus sp. HCP3S3_G5_2 TaxID=3438941 RepID=UPI003F899114